jgi:hypothetical protein
MGMNGMVFVRPKQNGNTSFYTSGKYAYNDGDGSTGYDREYVLHLSEVWCDSHWADAHIQLPEWSDYKADFAMLNGRVYPDTIAPHSPLAIPTDLTKIKALPVQTDPVTGDLVIPGSGVSPDTGDSSNAHLQYQPLSSLITCNQGERVLLRFSNLGFRESSMTLAGIRMRVVGKDATPMRGIGTGGLRNGADTSYETNTLSFGAGESFDALFTAPTYQGNGTDPDIYVLYNREYERSNNLAPGGFGGQRTEVHVYPTATLSAQRFPCELSSIA